MYKILILCSLSTVFSIIIKDPVPTEGDYKYSYEIEDLATGDRKSQHEVRQGDFVSGAYSLLGPDGKKRTVEYTADSKHGFQAVVREEPDLQPTTVQPTTKIPYVSKTRIYSKPFYSFEAANLPTQYDREEQNAVYFTPENEIVDKNTFQDGQYFEPAK